jgi:hypothetical protein
MFDENSKRKSKSKRMENSNVARVIELGPGGRREMLHVLLS